MKFPDKLNVLMAQARLIEETGGSLGIRDIGALESALAAAENRHRYENADLIACAATYAYHLTQAHALLMETSASLLPSQRHFWKAMTRNWR